MLINPFCIGIVRWRGLRDEQNAKGDRRRRLSEAIWARENVRLDAELSALSTTPQAEPKGPPLSTHIDTWKAGDTNERREVLKTLLTSVVVDMATGQFATWKPRTEWAFASPRT